MPMHVKPKSRGPVRGDASVYPRHLLVIYLWLSGSRTNTGLKPAVGSASAASSKGRTAVCTRRGSIRPLATSAKTSGISGRAFYMAERKVRHLKCIAATGNGTSAK